MTSVKIYKPAKTAMSSGRCKTCKWLIEMEAGNTQYVEPVMQWTASTTTQNQIKLVFESKEQAIQFATKNNWDYKVIEPHTKKILPKSYTDNFTSPKS